MDDAVEQWNQLVCGGVGRHLMDQDKRFRTAPCIEAWNAYRSTRRNDLALCGCRPEGKFYGLGEGTPECVEYCAAARSPFLQMRRRCRQESDPPTCRDSVNAFYQRYSHRRMRYCYCDYYTLPPPIDASIDD